METEIEKLKSATGYSPLNKNTYMYQLFGDDSHNMFGSRARWRMMTYSVLGLIIGGFVAKKQNKPLLIGALIGGSISPLVYFQLKKHEASKLPKQEPQKKVAPPNTLI